MPWLDVNECPFCGEKRWIDGGVGQFPVIHNPSIMEGVPLAVITTYRQCIGCGLIRQSPRLSDEEIADFYTSGVYRHFINDTQEQQDKFELARYKRIAAMMPEKSSDHLLDIGCSHGYLLDMMDGYDTVLGVEPNAAYVTTKQPTVRTLDEVTGLWDVIVCLHVLEHVSDPFQMARAISCLLAPGGWLFIETPANIGNGLNPYRLPHLYHFPPWIIQKMFPSYTLVTFLQTPHFLQVFRKVDDEQAA